MYEPTVWKSGDIITAEKLNKLENGVESAGGGEESNIVTVLFTYDRQDDQNNSVYRYSVSYDQLLQAFNDGKAMRGLMTNATTPSVNVNTTYGDEDYPDGFEFVFLEYSAIGLVVYTLGIYDTSAGTSILYSHRIPFEGTTN